MKILFAPLACALALLAAPDPARAVTQVDAARAMEAKPVRTAVTGTPLQRTRQRALTLLKDTLSDEAGPLLSELLVKLPNDPQLLGGLGLVRLRQGRHGEAQQLFERALQRDTGNAEQWRSLLKTASYWSLLQQARTALDAKQADLAEEKVRAALLLDADNTEGVLALARVLVERGDAVQAETLYRKVLQAAPDNDSAIRRLTALLAKQGRRAEALALLDLQGASAASVQGKYTYLRVSILRDQAADLARQGQTARAQDLLAGALSLEPVNPWVRLDLARLLHGGAPATARGIIAEGLRAAPESEQMLHASALYFALAGEPEQALRSLEKVPAAAMSAAMLRLRQRMQVQSAIVRAHALDLAGQGDQAAPLLDAAALLAADDPDLLYDVANAWMARQQPDPALELLRKALAGQPPPSVVLSLRLASLLDRAQHDAELQAVLRQLAGHALDTEQRAERERLEFSLALRTAYADLRAGNTGAAGARAGQLALGNPHDSRVLLLQGNIARQERRHGDAMAAFRHAKAAELAAAPASASATDADLAIASMERRRQGQFIVGFDALSKPATPGLSKVHMTVLPVEIHVPVGYHGHAAVYIDRIDIRAGALDPSDHYASTRFGKVQALAPSGLPSADAHVANGLALALGYATDNWRVDLGTTAQGFLVQDVVGGYQWSGACRSLYCSVGISRRAVTSSLLAYAGARDPVSGEVWGGVRSNAVDVRLGYEKDGMDASLSAGYHQLDGKNVLTNTHIALRPEISWTLVHDKDKRLSAGLAYTYWAYRDDLSYYTFGHGGYYSPQSYHSIAIPWRLSGRSATLWYALSGSVSSARSNTKDMPYYPNDPGLQSLAGNPMHVGGTGGGTGFSLGGAVETKIARGLYIGARFDIERAAYYMPNSASIYLRYLLGPAEPTAPLAPTPARVHARH